MKEKKKKTLFPFCKSKIKVRILKIREINGKQINLSYN